ncbi:MAG: cupredoxin domain-containing protein [Solirubrobacterales bacterium]
MPRLSLHLAAALVAAAPAVLVVPALAAEGDPVELTIKDHRFTPDRIEVPAGQKVTLLIKNQDTTAEEFDSHDLKREKVIPPGKDAKVIVGPLNPGEYRFIGEYHEKTAKGVLVAK